MGLFIDPFAGSAKLQVLYEQWISCSGHWSESSFLVELRQSTRNRKRGARKWMTFHEMTMKFGSEKAASQIRDCKRADPVLSKSQIRFHPDAPGVADPRLYWFGY